MNDPVQSRPSAAPTVGVESSPALAIGLPTSTYAAKWSSKWYECFNDMNICCFGFWCMPCLYGYNHQQVSGVPGCCLPCCNFYMLNLAAAILIQGLATVTGANAGVISLVAPWGFGTVLAYPLRQKLKAKYNIRDDSHNEAEEFVLTHFCLPCTICQEARELKYQEQLAAISVADLTDYVAPADQLMEMEPEKLPEEKPLLEKA